MAFSGLTKFLGLRKINSQDRSWLGDANHNLDRMDMLAKHVRVQTGDGTPMSLRAALASGALADVIKIEPAGTSFRILLGRANSTDTVALQGLSLSQATLRLQNQSDTTKIANVRTLWALEGIDAYQDTRLDFNTRNNFLTQVKLPLMGNPAIDNSYIGSAIQFELDPAGTAANTSWVGYTLQNAAATTKNYIQPVYKL